MKGGSMDWTNEDIAYLRKKWGLVSTLTIAKNLGVTKGSVVGKARRLGLPKLRMTDSPRKLSPYTAARNSALGRLKKRWSTSVGPMKPPKCIPMSEIRGGQCRYILGETNGMDTIFCGLETHLKTSWCEHHLESVRGDRKPTRNAARPTRRQ